MKKSPLEYTSGREGKKKKMKRKSLFIYNMSFFSQNSKKKEFPQWETLSYDFLRYILFLKSPILTKILRNGSLYRTGRL